ncbi:halocarboxylic acid dehydrogenase DehI family protein [Halogeometricum luteum]|uniref:Halocarboxylic acid dehydrogenase DehI family protein n=1 Tax=Halogeometricum luteum TaxID=2950537 RepID=A0ABU2FYV9_9EURY|nr:halocarboxylic acid dehydrogenase DehI family protein [Halogeometricum sp. S3BR5-2]MDS0293717.1 halocarboxylic acid dehydrogenase DehI family protein [Halogeometricum sp. S3BR5-2]
MDTDQQLHETDARGWRRGVYDDIKRTFRAPIVNWIFRTAMANEPEFTRYAWGQVKPLFETRAFARLTVEYRDAVLGELESETPISTYRAAEAGVSPAAYRELRGQLATYDVVAPRLAVLFETMDRALHDESVGADPAAGRAATEPFPEWLDRDRGHAPTLRDVENVPEALSETVESVQAFHGFDEGQLPSIYRTLAQWPAFFEPMWADLEPRLESDAFERACGRTDDLVGSFVDAAPYRPRLGPDDLERAGFDEGTVTGAQELFGQFASGPVSTVLPALPAYAATVDATGERDLR